LFHHPLSERLDAGHFECLLQYYLLIEEDPLFWSRSVESIAHFMPFIFHHDLQTPSFATNIA
jgi:hypothetical protein